MKVGLALRASGYIASWIVKLLLLRGYTVRASIRDLNDPKKTEHLLALDGAKERLHLFEANLLQDGSFDDAIDGCEGMFHTASPVTYEVKDPQETLIVLHSCAKSPSIKRVILTSSMAAVVVNGQPLSPEVIVDESWRSNPEFARENK
ncbi:Phenylacetaldehyde reductase-like protein, partial [Drosera capensis]